MLLFGLIATINFKTIIKLLEHFGQALQMFFQPEWIRNRTPESEHFYRRTLTPQYRAKKRLVYYLWISVLLTMLIIPFLAYVFAASLFTTFVSFMILDEME